VAENFFSFLDMALQRIIEDQPILKHIPYTLVQFSAQEPLTICRNTMLQNSVVATGGCNTPQASSLSAKLLRIKVLSAIFRKSILSQEDDS